MTAFQEDKKEMSLTLSQTFGELSAIFITSEIVVYKLLKLEESKICHLGKGYRLKFVFGR